jgi:hypothetical protein
MIVDDAVVIEMKAGKTLESYAARQLYNYLRATSLEAGLLFHFGPEPAFLRANSRHKIQVNRSISDISASSSSVGEATVRQLKVALRLSLNHAAARHDESGLL